MAQQKKRSLMNWFLVIGLTELAIVFLVVPYAMILSQGAAERTMNVKWLGEKTEQVVKTTADTWYTDLFIDTGIYEAVEEFLVTGWTGDRDRNLKLDDRGVGELAEARLSAAWAAIYLTLYRLAGFALWGPYVVPFLVPALVDGVMERERRKWMFTYASPMLHNAGASIMGWTLAVGTLLLVLPFAMPPVYQPVLLAGFAVSMWIVAANIQKRM
jgi:hypothetical protein